MESDRVKRSRPIPLLGGVRGGLSVSMHVFARRLGEGRPARGHEILKSEKNWLVSIFSQDRRSEEHTSELQSQSNLVCRLLLEKKKIAKRTIARTTSNTSIEP